MPLPLENFGLDLATPQSIDFQGLHPPRNAMASQRGVGGDVDSFFVPVTVFKLYVGTCRIPQNTGYIIQNLDLLSVLTVAFIMENAQSPLIVGLWRQQTCSNTSLADSLFLSCFILSIQQSHSYFSPHTVFFLCT